ncbi:MAG: hypothetical protein QW761_02960 [Candidatus Aenigmatarchaeota archaeon]
MKIRYINSNSRIIESAGNTIYQEKINNKWVLHRERLPAVITPYHEQYYYHGIKITKEIAEGTLPVKKILEIKNAEIRRIAMYLAIEKVTSIAEKIDQFTPEQFQAEFKQLGIEMYTLYRINEKKDELQPFVFLEMVDPSKRPVAKYYVRVPETVKDCKQAVAQSYGFKSWEEYIKDQKWV